MFYVVSVTPHGRSDVQFPMYHVVLGKQGHRTLNLYLTSNECEAYGIDVPTRNQAALELLPPA